MSFAIAFLLIVAGAALLAALALRGAQRGARALKRRQAALPLGCALGCFVFFGWWFGLRETLIEPNRSGHVPGFEVWQVRAPPSSLVYDALGRKPVGVGDRLPPLRGKGWINGQVKSLAEIDADIIVVDVWNELCPVCHEAAAALMRLHDKYEDRGVAFVGFTVRGQDDAEAFINNHGIDWPNAYGVTHLGLAAPQVFIVNREGEVLWFDDRLRYRHMPEALEKELDKAIPESLSRSRSHET